MDEEQEDEQFDAKQKCCPGAELSREQNCERGAQHTGAAEIRPKQAPRHPGWHDVCDRGPIHKMKVRIDEELNAEQNAAPSPEIRVDLRGIHRLIVKRKRYARDWPAPIPTLRGRVWPLGSMAILELGVGRAESQHGRMNKQARGASQIHVAKDEIAVRQCFSVFRELRPHLRSADDLVERWHKQLKEGYEIVFIREAGKVVAAAGYRFFHTMAWGSILYLDDLVVAPSARGLGLGAALLQFVQRKAKDHGCDSVHLDTGYQRYLAHKSYLRNGFYLRCHHMAWETNGTK